MCKLRELDEQHFGVLRKLENPDDLIFRSTSRDFFEIAVESVLEYKADVLSEDDFQKKMDEQIVVAFARNAVTIDYPVVIERRAYSDYLEQIRKTDQS